ncbi:MAG: sialidase family protein [Acidimicrobiales bacterium]
MVAAGVLFAGALLAPAAPAAAADRPNVIPEVPVTATDMRVGEANNSPAMAADPSEPRFLALAHRTDAPDFSCGLQVSGDGGRGWQPANPVPQLPEGAEKCYAPEVAIDREGRLYYLFLGLQGEGNSPMGVFLTSSTDRGRSFTPPQMVLGPENYMVRMALDPDIGDRGRIHLVWLRTSSDPPLGGLPSGDNPLVAAHSDDGGRTFSEPVRVSDPDRPRSVAPSIALGPDHAVHVAYMDLRDDARDYQGLEGPPWEGEWSVVVASSTDGGATFGPGVTVDDALIPPGRVMLIFTMPPPALVADSSGRLYAAWWDSRNGDPDAFLARSPDGGRTWEAPVRLNDDTGSGSDQYLVRLSAAENGRVDAVFLDRRQDPENLRNDVYLTYSTDNGRTFAPNVKLTTHSSDSRIGQAYYVPSAAGLVEFGSRLAILSRPNAAIAAWPDTRNATLGSTQQDVFSTEVLLPGDDGGGPGRTWIAVALTITGTAVVLVALRTRRRRPEEAG